MIMHKCSYYCTVNKLCQEMFRFIPSRNQRPKLNYFKRVYLFFSGNRRRLFIIDLSYILVVRNEFFRTNKIKTNKKILIHLFI